MPDIARQRAPQQVHRLARHFHAAAGFVDERDHPVDIGPVFHPLFVEIIADLARHGGRAVHGDEQADIVARADLPVGAADAHEGGALVLGQDVRGHVIAGKGVILVHRVKADVVAVQPVARSDVMGGIADDRLEFQDRRTALDRADGDLVALRRVVVGGHPVVGQRRALGNRSGGNHHVVAIRQQEYPCGGISV